MVKPLTNSIVFPYIEIHTVIRLDTSFYIDGT